MAPAAAWPMARVPSTRAEDEQRILNRSVDIRKWRIGVQKQESSRSLACIHVGSR
jgi:hypothetical protein